MEDDRMQLPFNSGRQLAKKYQAEFSLIGDCLCLQDSWAATVNTRLIKRAELSIYQAILASNLHKATNCIMAISILSDDGKTEDGRTLVRKLIELAVNMKYLALDPDHHTKLYAYHQAVRRYHRALRYTKSALQPDSIRQPLQQALPRLEEEYNAALQYFPKDKNGKIQNQWKNSWTGLPIQTMAENTGLAEHYAHYDLFSISTHTSIEDFGTYFDFDNSEFVEGLDPSEVPALVLKAVDMYTIILQLASSAFAVDITDELETIRSKAQDLGSKLVQT